MKRLTKLTPEQTERMASFAQEWIEYGWRTTPLTEEEWAVWEAGARRCYEYAGIPWPGVVVRVSSPIVGAFAAPIADVLISRIRTVGGAVGDAVDGAVRDAVGDAVGGAVDGAVRDAVDGAVGDAVDGAVGDAVGGAVGDAVDGAVDGAVGGAVRDAVRGAVGDAVDGAVRDAVRGAVRDAVGDAVGDAVDGAVRDAVDGAVRDAVRDAVDGAVDGAVGGAVDGAVGDAVDGAVRGIQRHILNRWYYRLGGRHWAGWWQSYVAFFRDIVELQIADVWDRSRAYQDAQSAGWWWPFRDFVMVCDVPTTLHVEQVGPTGWGSHRLHCENGPAVAWADGWGVYSWHGTRVPAWVVDGSATVDMIMRERNTEVRRCAVEAYGWPRFVRDAGLSIVGTPVADPGNPGHDIALYDVPRQLFPDRVRILLCTNGTPEPDGTRHQFGLSVPAEIEDPIAAAAWGYDMPVQAYRQLEVRR